VQNLKAGYRKKQRQRNEVLQKEQKKNIEAVKTEDEK